LPNDFLFSYFYSKRRGGQTTIPNDLSLMFAISEKWPFQILCFKMNITRILMIQNFWMLISKVLYSPPYIISIYSKIVF
jgi:hypothetical protein